MQRKINYLDNKINMNDDEGWLRDIFNMLSRLDRALQENLKNYGIERSLGLFRGLSFILAISVGAIAADILMTGYDSSFLIMFLILSIFLSPISLFVCGHIISPIYGETYDSEEPIKSLLAYQMLNSFIGIVLYFAYKNSYIIYSSWVIFFILGFIHPVSKYLINVESELTNIKNTVKMVYNIITLLFALVTLLFQYVDLFNL